MAQEKKKNGFAPGHGEPMFELHSKLRHPARAQPRQRRRMSCLLKNAVQRTRLEVTPRGWTSWFEDWPLPLSRAVQTFGIGPGLLVGWANLSVPPARRRSEEWQPAGMGRSVSPPGSGRAYSAGNRISPDHLGRSRSVQIIDKQWGPLVLSRSTRPRGRASGPGTKKTGASSFQAPRAKGEATTARRW